VGATAYVARVAVQPSAEVVLGHGSRTGGDCETRATDDWRWRNRGTCCGAENWTDGLLGPAGGPRSQGFCRNGTVTTGCDRAAEN
jgi:hypothetical protein